MRGVGELTSHGVVDQGLKSLHHEVHGEHEESLAADYADDTDWEKPLRQQAGACCLNRARWSGRKMASARVEY